MESKCKPQIMPVITHIKMLIASPIIMRSLQYWKVFLVLLTLVMTFLLADYKLNTISYVNYDDDRTYNRKNPVKEKPPDGYVNVMDLPRPKYLDNYKNPCWRQPTTEIHSSNDKKNRSRKEGKDRSDAKSVQFYCLPYYYYIGFPKTGTTDLYAELTKHPMILSVSKSPHWWSWKRIGYRLGDNYQPVTPFEAYLNKFVPNIGSLDSLTVKDGDKTKDFHPCIFGDASPSTIWSNFKWHSLPENEGYSMEVGPHYHVGHYIAHFTPKALMIVTMRNPTDREYSWYKYTASSKSSLSPQDFHNKVVVALSAMEGCLHNRPAWSCVNDVKVTDVIQYRRVRLQLGMYVIWLREWLKVFPRQQFHFSTLEDYSINKTGVLRNVFSFLRTDPMDVKIYETSNWRNKAGAKKESIGHMLPETKVLLDRFYKPFNKMLADLLGHDKYLFLETT